MGVGWAEEERAEGGWSGWEGNGGGGSEWGEERLRGGFGRCGDRELYTW